MRPLTLYNLSEFIYQKSWNKVGELKLQNIDYDISKHNSEPSYVVGNMIDDNKPSRHDPNVMARLFAVVLRIDLDGVGNNSNMGYQNLYEVQGVAVDKQMQGASIALQIYKWLLQNKINLLSDYTQYFGARALWSKLSHESDVIVDVVNFATKQILDRNVKLHQGKIDADYDKNYWSADNSKMEIRFVLRNIT